MADEPDLLKELAAVSLESITPEQLLLALVHTRGGVHAVVADFWQTYDEADSKAVKQRMMSMIMALVMHMTAVYKGKTHSPEEMSDQEINDVLGGFFRRATLATNRVVSGREEPKEPSGG